MSILVYTENWDGKFKKQTQELLSYANEIAKMTNSELVAISIGNVNDDELKTLGKYGASKVYNVNDAKFNSMSSQAYTKAISEIAEKEASTTIVFANTYTGRSVAPRVTVRLNAGLVAGCVALPNSTEPFIVKKKAYSGKAFADVKVNSAKRILTLNQNSYKINEDQKDIEIVSFSPTVSDADFKVKSLEISKASDHLDVGDAEILVTGGRGMKSAEKFAVLDVMADAIGPNCAVACSRPVSDLDWRPHYEHVGQTGKVVAPNLYFAFGISGAIQHLAGVNSSKVIVAVNTDKDAPIFEAADYGIIGDAFEVVPKLIDAIKELN
jgi:electron transfer flavoprotein alpha subunit